jgi:hypothetical protein
VGAVIVYVPIVFFEVSENKLQKNLFFSVKWIFLSKFSPFLPN